jgi:hypothetical protein
MERIQKILNSEISKKSVNTDTLLKINIEGKEKLLPPDEINKIINVGTQFNLERNNSPFYRIIGTINNNVSNALFNLSDDNNADLYTYRGFNYVDISTSTYRFNNSVYPNTIDEYLKESDGWYGYYNPNLTLNTVVKKIDMEPKRERFSFIPDVNPFHNQSARPIKNWELTITYPFGSDKTHPMINDGLLIVEAVPAIVATRNMVAFGMPCMHNLSIGDVVKISGTSGYDGEFVVIRTGLDNGDLKEYYFVVDLPPTGLLNDNSRMKKMIGGFESEYYFRIFKKIKTRSTPMIENDDYDSYKLAFSENVYNDSVTQFIFNEDIDVSELKDNLGRPLSQIYLTVLKTASGFDSNKLFGAVSAGIETPFISKLNNSETLPYLLDIPAINKIHNAVADSTGIISPFISHNPLSTNVNINNNTFYGDLVEYNKSQLKEFTLADVSHRFNTLSREFSAPIMKYNISAGNVENNIPPSTGTTTLGPRQEGYFYKAHHLIPIREFSDYVEQGDLYTEGMPTYAVDLGDGRFIWRDLLDIGVNQSNIEPIDYPFLNGCHYIHNNYCFTSEDKTHLMIGIYITQNFHQTQLVKE